MDAHTHLDFEAFDADRDAVLARARAAGVGGFVVAGADPASWARAHRVGRAIGAAVCLGLHPWWVRTEAEARQAVARLADLPDLDGIGETGLDHARARRDDERAVQRAALAAHVELAHRRGLPLVLHVVRAHRDALGILAALDVPAAGGMVHGWSAGPEWVGPALDLGLHLSFGTDLLRSARVRDALRHVPDERLLLETDCPDRPIGGADRGEPAHLPHIAARAAEIRGTTASALLALCGDNARRLFPRLQRGPGQAG